MTAKRHKFIGKAFFLLLFFYTAIHSFAQFSVSGQEFYVAFGKNANVPDVNAAGDSVVFVLRITGQVDADVTLSFTENSALDTTFHVPGGDIYDYTLTRAQAVASYSGRLTNSSTNKKSILITATELITLVTMNSAYHSIESTLIWPVESWGTEYYNIGLIPLNNSAVNPSWGINNCNGYLLIAKEADTHVSGAVNITLNAGEVYHYYSSNANTTGAHIVSDKPVAFFQTNTQASVRTSSSNPAYNYNYNLEQLPSVNQWGTKFIAPANDVGSSALSTTYTGFFRVYAKESGTTVTARFANGSVKTYTISNPSAANRYVDIILNIDNMNYLENNTGSNACYITSDKPVGICSIHTCNLSWQYPQPAIAWLPPLEQETRNVLMSPLDFNSRHVYTEMHHFFTVIVPTASKNNTTISIDGGPPQPIQNLSPQFQWMADNIGGSGYSCGRYYFGRSNYGGCSPNCYLNTTALVDNPDGLVMLAYGQGGYTKYFYNVGSAFRDLTASFTVNGEVYYKMDGKAYCNTSDFVFEAIPDTLDRVTTIIWQLNGTEIPGSRDQITVNVNNLPDGYYTAEMIAHNITYTTHFYVGGSPVVWTPEANTGSDKNNWNNAANWTPALVPSSCHTVFIPGNSTHYPNLTSAVECYDIYFMQGAELGRPDRLTYRRAHVQLNFDLKQYTQQKNNDKNLVLRSTNTRDRLLYSAAVSADPLSRERWYMLSSPLRSVVTGDLSFGGFPLTFLMKFGPVEKDGMNYSVGKWTATYTSLIERVAASATNGFAFYMYGYQPGGSATRNLGCVEFGSYTDLGDLAFLPSTRNGLSYGIRETNGILELPFFEDDINLHAHRTQIYDPAERKSVFYTINDGTFDSADFNRLIGTSVSVTREANSGNYRFAPETPSGNTWAFPQTINHPGAGLGNNDEFLVGNPYMSSIDMVEFIRDNTSTVHPQYQIWNGMTFVSYSLNGNSFIPTDPAANPDYVAPMQGFFLKTLSNFNGGANAAKFDVTKISTVRPSGTGSNLRSSETEENLLRIKAENQFAASYAVIGHKDKAGNGYVRGEDVEKLFSPYGYVPSVYSLADNVPIDINFINNNENVIVPLGIKTEQTGEIRLTFTGMDNYLKASKIEFIDALEGRTVDLTGKSSYTCVFNNTGKGAQNGRFLLRIGTSMTALPNVTSSDNLYVYGNSKEIFVISSLSDPVLQVIVYDFQGRKVFESASGATYYPLPEKSAHSPLIVKVITKNQVKTAKIN